MLVIEEFNNFGEIAAGLAPLAGRIVHTTVRRIEARAKGSLSGPRTGIIYRRGARGDIEHQASAPGEPPATDTGNLAASIGSRMIGPTEGEITVTAEYAAVLELGGVHVAARPYFRPAIKAEWPHFLNAMKVLGE